MRKVCLLAAVAVVGASTFAAAQGPDRSGGAQGGPRGGAASRSAPAPQQVAPQRFSPPPRASAPQRGQRAVERPRATEQRRAVQQRRATGERAAERRRAVEQQRTRAAEQQRRARAAERQRSSERRQAADKQRASGRQRAAEEQRATEQRRAAERPDRPANDRQGAARTAKHEQLRQERTKLSNDQRVRLRRAFPVNRDRIAKVRFTKRVGSRIPRSVRLFAVPAAVFAIFPYYRDYRYVVEDDVICIVDPVTYEIVDVLDEGGGFPPVSRPQVAELSLTPSERAFVLDSIPPDFPQAQLQLRLALGADIPGRVELHQFAPIVLDRVPKLRDFRFLVAQDQVVIVTPRDRSIALVLER